MRYLHSPEEVKSNQAATAVVPKILELFSPNSVIDVGCGTGNWLKVFETNGITDYLGLDGTYVTSDKIVIDLAHFKAVDLEGPITLDRKFDLLTCLEVAEHLSYAKSESLIRELTQLSDTIVFSAAIPLQVGQNHINEQYPDFWVSLFKKNNFNCYDILRPLFWNNDNVDWWYRQNMLVFIKEGKSTEFTPTDHVNPLISRELYEVQLATIKHYQRKVPNFTNIKRVLTKYAFGWLQKMPDPAKA